MPHLRSPERSRRCWGDNEIRRGGQRDTTSTSMASSYAERALESPRKQQKHVSIDCTESPMAATASSTSPEDDGYPGEVLEDMAQSPLTPSKKMPLSRSSYATLAAQVKAPFSPDKKSPRRKKQGGLGGFLSKYNDKEDMQEQGKGVYSSGASYNGSVGSESTGSKQSIASMPARLPLESMEQAPLSPSKKTSNQTSVHIESAALKSPRRQEKASPVETEYPVTVSASPDGYPGGASEDMAQAPSSLPSKKAPSRKSSSATMEEAVVQAPPLSMPNKKSSPNRKKHCGLGAFLSKYDDKKQQQGRKGMFSSSGSYTGSIGSESTGSKKSITSMPARMPLMFSRSGRSDTKESVSVKGQKQSIGKTNGNKDTSSSSPSTTRQSPIRTASFPRKALQRASSWRGPKKPPTRCASYQHNMPKAPQEEQRETRATSLLAVPPISPSPSGSVRPKLNRGGLVKTPSLRMNGNFGIDQQLGDQAIAKYEQLLLEFEADDSVLQSDVPLSAPTERTKFSTMSGRVEGVRKALPGPPLLHTNCSESQVNQNTSEEESLQRNRPEDDIQRQVNRNASEQSLQRVRPPERRRQFNRSTSEESLTCAFQRPPPEKRQVNRIPSTPDEMIKAYHTILSEFNDSSDMDNLLAYASCSSLHVDNLLLLNSCNSMDISNNFVADSCSTMDVNHLLDMNSSSDLDASITDTCAVSEQNNNDKNDNAATATNNNNCRTTAKPAPATFRKPRPLLPKLGNGGGGAGAISSIPRRTRKLETKMIQKLDGDDDDDTSIDTSIKRAAISKSVASSATILDTASSSLSRISGHSPTSTGNHVPSLWTGDDQNNNHRGSQYRDEHHDDIVWDRVEVR